MSCLNGLRTLFLAQASITAIVGSNGVHRAKAPQGAALPYILLTKIGSEFNKTLTDTGGLVFQDVDIDCKAATAHQADDLAAIVRDFFQDYTGAAGSVTIQAVLLNDESEGYETPTDASDVGKHVTTLDTTVQFTQ